MDIVRLNEISGLVVDSAMQVHTEMGPGLLESSYRFCVLRELNVRGLAVRSEVFLPIEYRGAKLENAYRIDLLVEESIIVELKGVAKVLPVHEAQVLSYLRLSGCRIGLLINFHVPHLKDGIRRFVNRL